MTRVFYSQQGEDVYIFQNFINKSCPDGIFVELGAMNGITYSNTKFFEDELQMTGTLIEPTCQYHELKNNRPKCKCYNIAVHYKKEPVKFLGNHATAGLVETMADTFRKGWHKNTTEADEYFVDGEPIADIFEKSGIRYIDFLSIDVEGGEEVVLRTINYDIPIYTICIEMDGANPEKDERCRQILLERGFVFDRKIAGNEFWFNPGYSRKELLYDSSQKIRFGNSVYDLGSFKYLARHVVNDVENAMRESNE